MQKYIKYSVIFTIVVFAVLALIAIASKSLDVIKQANVLYFVLGSVFFVLSMVLWIIPWLYLIKKDNKISFSKGILVGYSCVYGALTPMQLGAEALRAIKAKDILGVPYNDSVSAAMLVKGLKFLIVSVLAAIVILVVIFSVRLTSLMLVGLLSGFVVIMGALLLFLLPLNKKIGLKIAKIFRAISKKISIFKLLDKYFEHYANYLGSMPLKKVIVVEIFDIISFVLEFSALWMCFLALNVYIGIFPLLVLFIIITILERTPFLPRGIGLVETAGFIFLSLPEFSSLSLGVAQIAAILVLYDVVRLIIPTALSFAISAIKIEPVKNVSIKTHTN